jgi:tetratricopeptide (TPR) repeat protein
MIKKYLFVTMLLALSVVSTFAQTAQNNADTVMILPFENASGKAEFAWVGESFADSLADLLKVPSLNVISNDERKIIQQRLRIPLTNLPSLATSLKLARESNASLLIAGKYNIIPAQGDTAATLNVTAKIIRVQEGRFLNEELPDGKRITRDINLTDALGNLQTVHGQVAYQILYQRDKALSFSQNDLVVAANKIPGRAFEAYIKGLLTNAPEARENYFKNALRLYNEAKTGETYADAALELGHFYLSQRKNSDAIESFSRIPQNSPLYAEAAFYTGIIQWQQNNYDQALAVLRPLAEDLKLTSVYNTIGAIAVQASRADKKNQGNSAKLLNEGLEMLKKAAESAPEESNARFNYGMALFLNGNYVDAAAQLRPVLAANPKDGESYYILAKSLDNLKDATAADFDNQAKRFLTENNKYAKLETEWQKTKTVGDINLRVVQPPRKDFVSVVLIKNQARPVQTPVSETETLLAQARELYKKAGDDDAMAVLRRVLASEPMNAESYLILGKIHLRRADLEQAISSFKTALFWDNRLVEAHVNLGKIYLDRGDCLQAKNYSASAAAIDAENQDSAALQRQVERCSTK